MPIKTPAMPANTPPTIMDKRRRTVSFSSWKAPSIQPEATMPENAPTLMKPAWPRLSSPDTPTTRLSETAMTTHTQMGTSWPRSERVMPPLASRYWHTR